MDLKIQQPTTGQIINAKKFRLKGCFLTSICPECGLAITRTLGGFNYLSCPSFGVPEKIIFQHEAGEVPHKWHEFVVMEITFRSATLKETKEWEE